MLRFGDRRQDRDLLAEGGQKQVRFQRPSGFPALNGLNSRTSVRRTEIATGGGVAMIS